MDEPGKREQATDFGETAGKASSSEGPPAKKHKSEDESSSRGGDVLITAESQAQTNADGTRSRIHLPNVEPEAEYIRAAFGNRADKHSRISVGRLNELLKDKRIWFCPAHGDAMLQGEPVLAFESDGRLEAVSMTHS